MIKQEILKDIGINGRFICSNTCYIGAGGEMSADKVSWLVPLKVRRRIRLNGAGLCCLATTILDDTTSKDLNLEMLRRIGKLSNEINRENGLPDSTDLVIRTSAELPFQFRRNGIQTRMSEPALLVTNYDSDNPGYRLLNKMPGVNKIHSIGEFIDIIPGSSFVLIHDDNREIQLDALHGNMAKIMDKYEIISRIGSLHARDMGDPDDLIPTMRISHENPETLLGIDTATSTFRSGQKITTMENIWVHTVNSTDRQAKEILSRIKKDRLQIWGAYRETTRIFGEAAVMEFRLYSDKLIQARQRMQVMDADIKF